MRTLVFADLHLSTEKNGEREMSKFLSSTTKEVQPQRIVLAGDIFESLLAVDNVPGLTELHIHDRFDKILKTWSSLFRMWNNSSCNEFIFLAGEHDHDILRPELLRKLQNILPQKKVKTTSHFFEEHTRSLILHGHQFDYNSIYDIKGKKISCIDGLTHAINRYVTLNPDIEKRVRNAVTRGIFSYWYAYGQLPLYLKAANQIFGCNVNQYLKDIQQVFRGGELDTWLHHLRDPNKRAIGKMTKQLARYPASLLYLYPKFYHVMEKFTSRALRSILTNTPVADVPKFCTQYGKVKNIIIGHNHTPRIIHLREGNIYAISSPRLHTVGIIGNYIRNHRDFNYMVIEGNNITHIHNRQSSSVPLAAFRQ